MKQTPASDATRWGRLPYHRLPDDKTRMEFNLYVRSSSFWYHKSCYR
jgi:hypothetical protein